MAIKFSSMFVSTIVLVVLCRPWYLLSAGGALQSDVDPLLEAHNVVVVTTWGLHKLFTENGHQVELCLGLAYR